MERRDRSQCLTMFDSWCWSDFSPRFRAISSSPRFGRDIQKIWNRRQLLLVMFDLFLVPNFAGPRSPSGESSHWGLIFRFKIGEPNFFIYTYIILSLFPAKLRDFFPKLRTLSLGLFRSNSSHSSHLEELHKYCMEHLADLRLCISILVYSCGTELDYSQTTQKNTDKKDHKHSTFGAKGWSTRIYSEALCRRAASAGAVCFKLFTKPFSKSGVLFHFQGRCRRCVGSLQCLKILNRFKLEVSLYTGLGDKKLQLPFNEVQPLSMSCFDMMLADSPDILNLDLGEMMWDVFSWCKHIKLHV